MSDGDGRTPTSAGDKDVVAGGQGSPRRDGRRGSPMRLAALDLGTNNCRLLIAAPRGRKLRIIDAYSQIVRLGEGVASAGVLSTAAMDRALGALHICAEKMSRRAVTHQRCIATQACRSADNGSAFLARVREETGLEFDVISPKEEARLSVSGCSELIDDEARAALIFDIGGGSTELSWLMNKGQGAYETAAWTSLPFGVVSLAEKYDGKDLSDDRYRSAVTAVRKAIAEFGDPADLRRHFLEGNAHVLGTSGTVTSIAGVHLDLPRYRRDKVDGLWLSADDAKTVAQNLRAMSLRERADVPSIGAERADLVVCGCAILEAILLEWPSARIRVADRGLREGILADLATSARRPRRRKKRSTQKI